jgi:hypothetical protein
MMPSAKMPIRLSAPPVNMFSTPPRPAAAWSKNSRSSLPSMPGTGM